MRIFVASILALSAITPAAAQQPASFTVTVVPPEHGTLQLMPAPPADGKYAAGTVVTVKTTPAKGYALDSAWYSVPGRFGQMYHEGMTPEFKVTIDRDKRIGASFIEASAVDHLNVTNDVVFAKPGKKPLKYDVYAPKGAKNLPIIVIVHGGGWVANDEDVMRGLARELTKGGRFVVASIDYRWAGKADGDATNNTMANLMEDVFGAIAHVMEHAKEYGGDPARIGGRPLQGSLTLGFAGALFTDSCGGDDQSLVVVALTANPADTLLRSVVIDVDTVTKTFNLSAGLDDTTAKSFGVYVPSSTKGSVLVAATARHSSADRTVTATQLSVPMQRYAPCGATAGSRLPIGGRTSPVRCSDISASTHISTPDSFSDISIHCPSPVRSRWCNAAIIATAA